MCCYVPLVGAERNACVATAVLNSKDGFGEILSQKSDFLPPFITQQNEQPRGKPMTGRNEKFLGLLNFLKTFPVDQHKFTQ